MNDVTTESRANFTAMTNATAEDWAKILAAKKWYNKGLSERALAHLKLLDGEAWGFPVDRLTHCLQSATLAHRAGMDEEYVVCALFHDVGYTISTYSHAGLAANMLQPFVSPQRHWMLAHHDVFEGYYFQHHLGRDRHAREKYRGHPCFELTADFCERFDQGAFDPNCETMPLEAFAPLVHRILSHKQFLARRAGNALIGGAV